MAALLLTLGPMCLALHGLMYRRRRTSRMMAMMVLWLLCVAGRRALFLLSQCSVSHPFYRFKCFNAHTRADELVSQAAE